MQRPVERQLPHLVKTIPMKMTTLFIEVKPANQKTPCFETRDRRPKEKVQEVDSLKKLPSSGLDPKFQGTLLNSDLNAIAKISGKANENREETDQSDPRFKTTRLTFTPAKSDEPKGAQSDSSPSPTPSPTVSPAAKSSGEPKQ